MVESFRAVVDIDGDASGALAAIARVEAALAKASAAGGKSFGGGDMGKNLDGYNKRLLDLQKNFSAIRQYAPNLSKELDLKNAINGVKSMRTEAQALARSMQTDLARKSGTVEQQRALRQMQSELNNAYAEAGRSLHSLNQSLANVTSGYSSLTRAANSLEKSQSRVDKAFSDAGVSARKLRQELNQVAPGYSNIQGAATRALNAVSRMQAAHTVEGKFDPTTMSSDDLNTYTKRVETAARKQRELADATEAAMKQRTIAIRDNAKAEAEAAKERERVAKQNAKLTKDQALERSRLAESLRKQRLEAERMVTLDQSNLKSSEAALRHARSRREETEEAIRTNQRHLNQAKAGSEAFQRRQAEAVRLSKELTAATTAETSAMKNLANAYNKAREADAKRLVQSEASIRRAYAGSGLDRADFSTFLRETVPQFESARRAVDAASKSLSDFRSVHVQGGQITGFSDEIAGVREYARRMEAAANASKRLNDAVTTGATMRNTVLRDQASSMAALQQAQERWEYAMMRGSNPPLGDQLAADERLANARRSREDAVRAYEQEAEALRNVDRASGEYAGRVNATNNARLAAVAAIQEETSALYEQQRAYQMNSNAMRYALYDAGRYNMMVGSMKAAPATLGAVAYGRYESMFSDYQRTAEIDNGGRLPSGKPALNLFDNVETASDTAFRGLMRIGRDLPVAYADIFDIAAKAGSIGIEGGTNTRKFTKGVSMFNVVSDADAATSAEAIGRIGNLLGTTDYTGIASSIVEVGKAAAATDDQILKTAQELAQAAAGAGFTADEIIGLSGAFASLSVPPERARSVMMELVKTMSDGMASVTPEIEAMARGLGMSTEEVQNLWKSNPSGLFTELVKAMSTMDEAEMVGFLNNIGMDGMRAMPTFQALAKNFRNMGEEANLLTRLLGTASEGFKDTSLLEEAVANKSDDLAGKLRALVNAGLEVATMFGAAMAGPAGAVLDLFSKMLSGVSALLSIPVVGTLAGWAASFLSLAGALQMIAGAGAFMRAGGIASIMSRFAPGANPNVGRVGTLIGRRYDLTAAEYVQNRSTRTAFIPGTFAGGAVGDERSGLRSAMQDRERLFVAGTNLASSADGAARNLNNVSRVSTQMHTSFTRLNEPLAATTRSFAATAGGAAAGGLMGRIGSGARGFGRNLNEFVGGRAGWTGMAIMAGLVGLGEVANATNDRMYKDLEARDRIISDTIFVPNPETGVVEPFKDAASSAAAIREYLRVLRTETKGAVTWTDKLGQGFNPFQSTESIMAQGQYATRNLDSTRLMIETYRKHNTPGSSVYYSRYHDPNKGNMEAAQVQLTEFARGLSGKPLEVQLQAWEEAYQISKMTADELATFMDMAYKDYQEGYSELVGQMNNVEGVDVESTWDGGGDDPGRYRRNVASEVQRLLGNYQASGDVTSSIAFTPFSDIKGTYLPQHIEQAKLAHTATVQAMDAEIAYQQALSAGEAYIDQYGAVLEETNGKLDLSRESHQELYGVMKGMAGATIAQAEGLMASGASMGEVLGVLEEGRESFINLARAAGMGKEEAAALADKLGLLPQQQLLDLIVEGTYNGDVTPAELLEVVETLPTGKSVTVSADAIGTESIELLRNLGYEVIELDDGTVQITATAKSEGLKETLADVITLEENGQVSINVDALTDQAKADLDMVSGKLGDLEANGFVVIPAEVDDQATAVLEALGYKVETMPDGSTRITAETDAANDRLNSVIGAIRGIFDKHVTITTDYVTNYYTNYFNNRRNGFQDTPYMMYAGGGHVGNYAYGGHVGGLAPFATSGYTGRGGKWKPVGIVHGGEYVIPKRDVDQSTGMPTVDALGRLLIGVSGSSSIRPAPAAAAVSLNGSVVDLGQGTLNALAKAVSTQIMLDGSVIARNSSNNFRKATMLGVS